MSSESQAPANQGTDLGLERLIFFSDAVFAIVITLLALDIRLPAIAQQLNDADVVNNLTAITPKFLAYFLSFFIIGSYWAGHHRQFNLVKRYDRLLLWLNLTLLAFIGLVPFATSLLSEHGNTAGTVFYAAVMAVVGLLAASMWIYAAWHGRFLEREIKPARWRWLLVRVLVAPVVFLVSIPLAFINRGSCRIPYAPRCRQRR